MATNKYYTYPTMNTNYQWMNIPNKVPYIHVYNGADMLWNLMIGSFHVQTTLAHCNRAVISICSAMGT